VGEGILRTSHVTYIGLRVANQDEASWLRENKIGVITSHQLKECGVKKAMERIARRVGNAPVHVSFDINVVDPQIASGTESPVPHGLDVTETWLLVEKLTNLDLVSVEVVGVNEQCARDGREETSRLATRIVQQIVKAPPFALCSWCWAGLPGHEHLPSSSACRCSRAALSARSQAANI